MSAIVQLVGPACEPVSVQEAKNWLHVDADDEDALILGLIAAARQHAEVFTQRALITQTFELSLDAFPVNCRAHLARYPETRACLAANYLREIVLPRPPAVSVQTVKYYDTAGVLQTLSSAQYYVDVRNEPGRIVLNPDYDWPETQTRPNAVIIAYTAGYGTPSFVPSGIRTAIRFLVSHWFEQRTPVVIGDRAAVLEVPKTADTLLWQHRIPVIL